MARFLALEWNDVEARLVVANSRGSRVAFEQAFSVALQPAQPGADPSEVNVGERIAAALAARGLGRIDTLVVIGRTTIELRRLSLPPAPDNELPELVRFQAIREFNALEDDWPLDFLPLDDTPDQSRNVLAAAIDPQQVDEIHKTCQAAGLKLRRMLLRPCAAASLMCRSQVAQQRGKVRLLVDLLVNEADLTVMLDRTAIFLRSARLPADPLATAESPQALLSEIRRTIAAAQNQLGGCRVESLVLCGSGKEHAVLAKAIQRELSLPADLLDPFEGLQLEGELLRTLPEHADRFAPLLGALLDELEETGHAIDFLHPRRPPEPPSRRNVFMAVGSAAAILVLALIGYNVLQTSRLNGQIKRLNAESTALDKQVKQAVQYQKAAAEIGKWTSSTINWLDELHWLSGKTDEEESGFPPAEEAMITQLTLSPHPRGGEMELKLLAESVDTITKMEQRLRDQSHQVKSGDKFQDKSQKHYSERFDLSVFVSREEP